MKSRISIDVDHENQPIIRVDLATNYHNQDLRDKLLQRFFGKMEDLSGDYGHSHYFRLDTTPPDTAGEGIESSMVYDIYPVAPSEMREVAYELLSSMGDRRRAKTNEITPKDLILIGIKDKLNLGELSNNMFVKKALDTFFTYNMPIFPPLSAQDMIDRLTEITSDAKLMKHVEQFVLDTVQINTRNTDPQHTEE